MTDVEMLERVLEYGGDPKVWYVGDNAQIRWGFDGLMVTHWSNDD